MLVKILLVLSISVLPIWARNKFLEDCEHSLYKCCDGSRTEARGRNQKGCGVALCRDRVLLEECEKRKERGECVLKTSARGKPNYGLLNRMKNDCARTCGFCSRRPPAPPKMCLSTRSGCCWDDSPARGPNRRPGKDCPVCYDKRPSLCKVFRHFCYQKAGPSARDFLRENCKLTCGIC